MHWSIKYNFRKHLFYVDVSFSANYRLIPGATCPNGYGPITSKWEDCRDAGKSLGYNENLFSFVFVPMDLGTERPQGCFQSDGSDLFLFNTGAGGNFMGTDKILCKKGNTAGIFYIVEM